MNVTWWQSEICWRCPWTVPLTLITGKQWWSDYSVQTTNVGNVPSKGFRFLKLPKSVYRISTMDQIIICNINRIICSDKPTENYHSTQQFYSALLSVQCFGFWFKHATFMFWCRLTNLIRVLLEEAAVSSRAALFSQPVDQKRQLIAHIS